MTSITTKKINGKTYYYARRCQRVGGKPKIVWQKYLGSADKVVAAMEEIQSGAPPAKPSHALVMEFGAVMALFDLAQRLRIVDHIDRHVPKRGSGPSVGTYLLIAILNRCVWPCSKAAIGDWFNRTVLPEILDIKANQLTSQRFWDNMDLISPEAIERIEFDVVSTLIREFNIDLRHLIFDATNFFTFIDSFNDRVTLAQRGHSKQERASLRIVGLALLITTDFHLPLFHRTYPGNQPDSPTFSKLVGDLAERCRELVEGSESITLVLDKGNNSEGNFVEIENSQLNFVGSLVPTQHQDLLKIRLNRFTFPDEEKLPGVLAFRTIKEIFGVDRTVLVTFNEKFFYSQVDTLIRETAKRRENLKDLQKQLKRWSNGKVKGGRPPSLSGVRKKIDKWLKARHMKDLFSIDLTEQDGLPRLHYRFNQSEWNKLQSSLLGKTILFTDHDDWGNAEIIRAYRSQSRIEDAFRRMKDTHHIALRPQHHWTDQKIQVHVFYCVLALMLISLLQRNVHEKGLGGSIVEILDQLSQIRQVGIVYSAKGGSGKPALKVTHSQMSDRQQALFEALDLGRHLPS